jgi:uncharacterized cupredoxin-like copper-binding protein
MDRSKLALRPLAMIVAAALLMFAFAACGSDDEGGSNNNDDAGAPNTEAAETPADDGDLAAGGGGTITVNATEYAFDLPETLPAGETEFALENVGEEPHMLIVAELKEDAPSVDDLINMDDKEAQKFIEEQQVIDPIKPGESSEKTITFDLQSGATYAYVCFVPSPKKSEGHGQPHAFLGMKGEFTVE